MKQIKQILFIAIAIIFTSFSCASFRPAPTGEIVIFHTNDTHGRVLEGAHDGMGFPRIQTIVKKYRKDYYNSVLLLDAGDTFHGTTFANLSKGKSVATIMDSMEYDAVTVGNHDMNFGLDRLKELDAMMEYTTILSANLKDSKGDHPFTPYIIKNLGPKGKIKVGIFGLSTPETIFKSNPLFVKDLSIDDPVTKAQEIVDELRSQVDIIICLSHLGVNESYASSSIEVAREVRGIDLIIDGHSHTILDKPLTVMGTPIVQAGYSDKYLGMVKISFGPKGAIVDSKLISSTDAASYSENLSILSAAEAIEEQNKAITGVVIGNTEILLDGERVHVRTSQTNLGTIAARSLVSASGADVALINGGSIRESIMPGDITLGNVLQVFPFGNTVQVLELKGEVIKEALEHGVRNLPESAGCYPQVYGMTFDLNPSAEPGNRVSNIKVGDKAIDLNSSYTLATSDFLVLGGDEYSMLSKGKVVKELGTMDDLFKSYLMQPVVSAE